MANNIPNNRNKGYQRKNFQFGNKREELKRARQNATLDDALKEIEKVKLNKSPSLSLDYFPIDTLPDEVFELTFLKKLYCRETQFSEIPAKIELLSNLETLELYGNKLTSLPKELFNLKKLVNLNVQNNHIESLPKEIGLLENLETILFKKNSIKDLPTEFSNLKKLQRFDFSDNK